MIMGGFSYALGLVGGLALFLFGMNVMGEALEKRAGNKMKKILEQLTRNKWTGLLLGLAVTSVIQSSSATTVMVVGFVNSGLTVTARVKNWKRRAPRHRKTSPARRQKRSMQKHDSFFS